MRTSPTSSLKEEEKNQTAKTQKAHLVRRRIRRRIRHWELQEETTRRRSYISLTLKIN